MCITKRWYVFVLSSLTNSSEKLLQLCNYPSFALQKHLFPCIFPNVLGRFLFFTASATHGPRPESTSAEKGISRIAHNMKEPIVAAVSQLFTLVSRCKTFHVIQRFRTWKCGILKPYGVGNDNAKGKLLLPRSFCTSILTVFPPCTGQSPNGRQREKPDRMCKFLPGFLGAFPALSAYGACCGANTGISISREYRIFYCFSCARSRS